MAEYPCSICALHCEENEECVFCSGCDKWVHAACVPMTSSQLVVWSDSNLDFLCRNCCFTENTFDPKKSLRRLYAVLDSTPRELRLITRRERLILQLYDIQCPQLTTDQIFHHETDNISVEILKVFHPAILNHNYPAKTVGDGNCMYRAVSKAMTGTEDSHSLLRLLTMLEILRNPSYYDDSHSKHVDLIQDMRIVTSPYQQLLKNVCRDGSYADMMHMYALSAAIQSPIRSYYPPQFEAEFISEPYTRKIVGRNVKPSAIPIGTIMWTQYLYNVTADGQFVPNHFRPLATDPETSTRSSKLM